MVNEIFEKLSALPQVEAIALGGSRANGVFDEKSDYDVYVYVTDNIDNGVRKKYPCALLFANGNRQSLLGV